MPSLYRREVLSQALDILWRKKYLWFLGFFAGLATYGGEANFFFRNWNAVDQVNARLASLQKSISDGSFDRTMGAVGRLFTESTFTSLAYLLVIFVLLATFVWLITMAQAGIIWTVGRMNQKKSAGFAAAMDAAAGMFSRFLKLNVLGWLITTGFLVVVTGIPVIVFLITDAKVWSTAAGVGFFLVTIPISMTISFILKYAGAAIALEQRTTQEAFRMSWRLFKKNWLVSIELAVIVYLICMLFYATVVALLFFFVTPFTITGFLSILAILAFVLSLSSAFSYASWTIIYQKLVAGDVESKIGQWTTRLVNLSGAKKAS